MIYKMIIFVPKLNIRFFRGFVTIAVIMSALFQVAMAKESDFPLYGVLTQSGYMKPAYETQYNIKLADVNFLIPVNTNEIAVKRYNVVNETYHPMPLNVYAGWWFCITEGKIIREPDTPDDYGLIIIHDFEIDQTNGERGIE